MLCYGNQAGGAHLAIPAGKVGAQPEADWMVVIRGEA